MSSDEQRPSIPDHELIRTIGSGSYGVVWLARSVLGVHRAIKIVSRTRFDHARPFEREYEGIKRFEPISRIHEAFVDILQVGGSPTHDFFYYVMELADDTIHGQNIVPEEYRPRTLASDLAASGALTVHQTVQIGLALSQALEFLHSKDLIHRDIKPANVVFVGGKPKLADISLVSTVSEANTYVGTSGFIAPEGPNSVQGDLYSLGKVLYELVSGKDRNDFPALPDQSSFTKEFLELNEVLIKACQRDVRLRYRTAAEMTHDLLALANGRSVRRLHTLERRVRFLRTFGLVAASATLLLGGVLYHFQQQWHHRAVERQRQVGTLVAMGTALMRNGDYQGAMPPLVEALSLEEPESPGAAGHRLRLALLGATAPQKVREWRLPAKPIRYVQVHGTQVLVAVELEYFQVFHGLEGKALSEPLGLGTEPVAATFMADGEEVLSTHTDGTVARTHWRTGKREVLFQVGERAAFTSPSADGRQVIAGGQDGGVYLWNSGANPTVRRLEDHGSRVIFAKFSPSGAWAVTTSSDDSARLWDTATGRQKCAPLMHKSWVYSADFSPDEQFLVTSSYDGTAKIWDLATGRERPPSLKHGEAVYDVRYSPDGHRILTAGLDRTAKIWDAHEHQPVPINHTLRHEGRLMTASFGPRPNQILTADIEGRMIFWDLRSRLAPVPWGTVPAPGETRPLRCETGSQRVQANGTQVTISGTASESARVLQLPEEITRLAISPENGVVAAVSGNQVHLISLQGSKHRILEHEAPVAHAEFSADGSMLVVAMADKTLERRSARLWNVRTGKPAAPPLVHDDGVLHAAFSPDGTRVVTSSEDFSAAIWNARTGEPLGPRLRHGDKVRSAQFATVHDWVVTASDDASAMVWDASTGEPLTMPLMHERRVMAAVFTDNDSALITTDEIGHQWRWNLQPDRKTETEPPSQRPSPSTSAMP
jgi:WD40 repeat protein